MATDLETRPASSKPDAYLRRKFADLCARIKRADLFAHLLALSLSILCYALFIGVFDWFAGNSTAVGVQAARWIGFGLFLVVLAYLLVKAVRCLLHRVNPYYVAHQIEQSSATAKNTLINWLDMQDQEMPAAFQRNLSARAAEVLQDCDVEKTLKPRKNGIMLGLLAMPALGLIVLMLLGPISFAGSMLRAFVPFYTPAPVARTQIALEQPKPADAQISPTQAIVFVARIEGNVPTGSRPDAPTLSYRYQSNEDFLTQPLQQDAAGLWTTQLLPGQIRTGFTYKISAGGEETPEHQVRVRGRAHVKKFEVTYRHRPYRKLESPKTVVFPNDRATRPIIAGPRGSEVELVIHASRPVKKFAVAIETKDTKKEIDVRRLSDDSFACQWTLDQLGEFRVLFATTDGEENADRESYPIDVAPDDAAMVVLDKPGKDVKLPANGTLVLEGRASSHVGIKELTLYLRVLEGPDKNVNFLPWTYAAGKSLQYDDGTFQGTVEYIEVVPLDQLPVGKGTMHSPAPGTVIEYWLEATDASDFPNPAGNVGASTKYKVVLTPPANAAQEESNRKNAQAQKQERQKQQQDKRAKENKDRSQKSGGGAKDPKKDLDAFEKEKKNTGDKLSGAMKKDENGKGKGESKSATPPNSATKAGPPDSSDGPKPKDKKPSMPPDNAGSNKDQGDGKDKSGEPKGDGKKSKDDASKGDRKDGPKEKESAGGTKDGGGEKKESAGGAKDAGPMGMNTPTPTPAKEPSAKDGGPTATAKGAKSEPQTQGASKGVEQNGPAISNKNVQGPQQPPPGAQAKGGAMNDAGASKSQPNGASQSSARGDDGKPSSNEPDWDRMQDLRGLLEAGGAKADQAGKTLADIAQNSVDKNKREVARDMLQANGRDPKNGQELKKGPSPIGISPGKSPGLSDELKRAAANREFAARIGQLQLADWQKRMTPELLKKAGISETDWQRYIKNTQSYSDLVRDLNAKIARDALKKDLHGGAGPGVHDVQNTGTANSALDGAPPDPPDLRDAIRLLRTPR